MSPIDVARERLLTPGCQNGHHLNAAGASLPTRATLDRVVAHLELEARTGGYEAADAAADERERVYALIADLLACAPDEVALVDSATTAWRLAVTALRLRPGDRVIVGRSEYVSNALALLALEREHGVVIEIVDATSGGTIDLAALERTLADGPAALVALGHVPTYAGIVEPVREVGAIARRHGIPFLVDATQSIGHLPVDTDAIGCDLLVATGRKFLRAPRGTGILVVRQPLLDRLEPALPDVRSAEWIAPRAWRLHDGARRFETWEHAPALRLGLGVAAEHALTLGIDAISRRIIELGRRLRRRLAQEPGVTVAEPLDAPSGIVTFTLAGHESRAVARRLAERDVHVVAVPASHGLWAFPGAPPSQAVVRASVHYYTDDSDIEALLGALTEIGASRAPA